VSVATVAYDCSIVSVGAPELIIILFLLLFSVVPLALLVVALIDAGKYDDATWAGAGQNKILWIVLVIFMGCLGPILYLTMIKSRLRAIEPNPS